MSQHQRINPPSLAPPVGYSYAVRAYGDEIVYFAGHTAMDERGAITAEGDMGRQFAQTLENLMATSEAAGVRPRDFVQIRIFVTDLAAYKANRSAIKRAYQRRFGDYYPAMTLVEVRRLWDEAAMIEIEAVAVRSGAD